MTNNTDHAEAAVNIVRSVCAIARTTGALPCDAENWVRGFLVKRDEKKDARIAELEAALSVPAEEPLVAEAFEVAASPWNYNAKDISRIAVALGNLAAFARSQTAKLKAAEERVWELEAK
jgi:hypothetical protein